MDLTHDIAPQDVFEAALFIAAAAPYFPPGAIHVAVVDPGVGTARRPLVAHAGGQFFVFPDNGLLTLYLRAHALEEARIIENPAWMRQTISATFHGRDIFAPAAARLALGAPMEDAGPIAENLAALDIPLPIRTEESITGEVIHIDRFGNAITNIHRTALVKIHEYTVFAADKSIKWANAYGEVPLSEYLALFGSADFLEIAQNRGDAAATLRLVRGTTIQVLLKKCNDR